MSKQAEEIVKNVNATMALENMPLAEEDIEIISKMVDEITVDEAIEILKKRFSKSDYKLMKEVE